MSFRLREGSWLDGLVFRLRARRILRRFPLKVQRAVDLGSGHEFLLLRYLLKEGRIESGVAVDLALAKHGPAEIRRIECDLGERLDLGGESVDVVLALAVLEHLDNPALLVNEAYRVLKPHGLLLLTTPSRRSRPLLEFLAYRLRAIDADEIRDHRHYFNETEIRQLLETAGFPALTIEYRTFLVGLNQFVSALK